MTKGNSTYRTITMGDTGQPFHNTILMKGMTTTNSVVTIVVVVVVKLMVIVVVVDAVLLLTLMRNTGRPCYSVGGLMGL